MEELAGRMSEVDILIVEGFKRQGHQKIEVHRPAIGKPLLYPEDDRVIAVASDQPMPDLPLPNLDLSDVPAVADFILAHYRQQEAQS